MAIPLHSHLLQYYGLLTHWTHAGGLESRKSAKTGQIEPNTAAVLALQPRQKAGQVCAKVLYPKVCMPSSFHPSTAVLENSLLPVHGDKIHCRHMLNFVCYVRWNISRPFRCIFQSCPNCLAVDCVVLAFHSRNQQAATSPQLQHVWALQGVSSMQKCRQCCPNLQEVWLCWIGSIKKSLCCQRAQNLQVHWTYN